MLPVVISLICFFSKSAKGVNEVFCLFFSFFLKEKISDFVKRLSALDKAMILPPLFNHSSITSLLLNSDHLL